MDASEIIVVGVDGSETARRALRWAVEEGAARGVEVHAIIAWTYEPYLVPGVLGPSDAMHRAEHIVTREVTTAIEGLPRPPVVLPAAIEGSAAQVLVDAAAKAAMLVVGTHGHGHLLEVLLGSVSADCVRHATCPVVVVPPPRTPHQQKTHKSSLVATPKY